MMFRRSLPGILLGFAGLLLLCCAAGARQHASTAADMQKLYDAVRANDLPTVKRMLQAGVDPNTKTNQTSVLFIAMNFSLAIQKELIEHGADVNERSQGPDDEKYTVLIYAIQIDKLDSIRLLLNHGAHLEESDRYGQTPLMYATYCRHAVETTRLLLSRGANINARDNDGKTPLMYAANYGGHPTFLGHTTPSDLNHLTSLEVLLVRHARVDAVDKKGWTPLMYAAELGGADNARVLLHYGAKVEAHDHKGQTALMIAMATPEGDDNTPCPNLLETLKVLIGAHANVNARDNDGNTTWDHAMDRPNNYPIDPRVFDLLYKSGAQVSQGLERARSFGANYKNLKEFRPSPPPDH